MSAGRFLDEENAIEGGKLLFQGHYTGKESLS
jgi:hypothetical protein